MQSMNINILFKPRYDLQRDWFEIQLTCEDGYDLIFMPGIRFQLGDYILEPIEEGCAGKPFLCKMIEKAGTHATE